MIINKFGSSEELKIREIKTNNYNGFNKAEQLRVMGFANIEIKSSVDFYIIHSIYLKEVAALNKLKTKYSNQIFQ